MISIETYVLSAQYTDECIKDVEAVAIEEAVGEAVAIAKEYTDQQIGVATWKIKFVNVLPPAAEADNHTLYFVPLSGNEENNHYYEYIYADEKWELLGSTEFKPDNYMTKQEVMDYVNDHQYVLKPATADTLGGVKVDTNSINLSNDGKISILSIKENNIANLFY